MEHQAPPQLPVCCAPEAFALLSHHLASLDSPDGLLHGAMAIAMHHMPQADAAAVDATLQQYADAVRARVRGRQPQALLAHLHDFLFDELAFSGNRDDYYSPDNSYLPAVLQNKRGLPITLCLLYHNVAQRLGLRCWGVALPGHFLCSVEIEGNSMLVDPFAAGRVLTPDEALERMREVLGPDAPWDEHVTQPATHRHWLTRILQNLLNTFGSAGRYNDVAAMLELEILLWPRQVRLHRDLALILARVGMAQPASAWLAYYLRANPDDPRGEDLKQLLSVLAE